MSVPHSSLVLCAAFQAWEAAPGSPEPSLHYAGQTSVWAVSFSGPPAPCLGRFSPTVTLCTTMYKRAWLLTATLTWHWQEGCGWVHLHSASSSRGAMTDTLGFILCLFMGWLAEEDLLAYFCNDGNTWKLGIANKTLDPGEHGSIWFRSRITPK